MLNGKLNADGTAQLTLDDASANFTASELEQAMQTLSMLRARMPEPVPDSFSQVDTVYFNPVYTVRLDRESKACLLSLRHGGFGWLHFELPTQEVLNMRTMWNHIVDRMDLEPPAGLYDGPERRRAKPH